MDKKIILTILIVALIGVVAGTYQQVADGETSLLSQLSLDEDNGDTDISSTQSDDVLDLIY